MAVPLRSSDRTYVRHWTGLAFSIFLTLMFATASRASLPSVVHYSEDFNYAYSSSLNASTAWDGSAGSEIAIHSSDYYLRVNGGAVAKEAGHTISPAYQGANRIIWVHVKVMPGSGGDTMWGLWLDDASGNNLARFYGNAWSCRGRIGGTNVVTGSSSTLVAGWNDLDIRIDTAANTSEFFHNGVSLGVLDHTSVPADTVSKVRFERIDNSGATGQYLYFDELRVGEEPVPTDPPAAPTVTAPSSGSVVQTLTPAIQWTGDSHDKYEVHINTTNDPADSNGWDSGEVAGSANNCTSGTLANNTRYYVFARLRNAVDWGPWSAIGRYFDVNVPIRIIPEPQQLTWKTGASFQVTAQTRIVVNANPDAKDTFTANQLRRKVWDITGFLPAIVQGGAGAPTSNVIAIGDPARNTAVASIIAGWPDAVGKAAKTEGYLLGVKDGSVVIRGFDQSGTFYGCQTLIQMLEYHGAAPKPVFCYDYPDLQWRGTMVRMWESVDSTFFRELISEVMARFKLNVLQIDMGMGVIWPSHPELYYGLPPEEQRVNPTTLPVAAALADYAKQHFMEVIPAGPSWSHSDGLITASTLNTLLRENRSTSDPASGLETLCHRNPQSLQIMHDLWNDMITYFDPNYIHTGWDEISDIGHNSCPYCRTVSKTTLFNEFLTSDRNWLAASGIGMVMWADMLRPDMNGGGTWNLSAVAATMPKDIILEDWEYTEVHDNNASVARWNANGLPSCGAPYGGYTPFEVNIYNWGNICDQYNTRGLVAFNKYRCGAKAGMFANSFQWMEVGNMIFYGEWGWTPGKPNVNPLPYDGETMVRRQVSPDRPVGFGSSLVGSNVYLTWTNPTDTDYQATWICYRTDRYPADPTDGIFVGDAPGAPGQVGVSFAHTAAPLGATIYYAAFSHDSIRHFSPLVTASVSNGSPLSLSSLSSMPDGKPVNVGGCVVTGVYASCFYVENQDRTCGLRVESTEPVAVGNVVTVNGILGKTGAERSLTALSVAVTGQQNPLLRPLAVRNSALGGADKGSVPGSSSAGTNNVGLLVTAVGRKLNPAPDGTCFYVDDGSTPGGVKVILTGTKTPIAIPSATYMAVIGVCSLDGDGNAVIRPRTSTDIVPQQ